MPYLGSQTNEEFYNNGISHQVNPGRANLSSISLQQDSDRWDQMSTQAATTPHSVLSMYSFSRSPNGSDGQGFLPNGAFLGSSNGASADDFDKSLMLRMAVGNRGVA
jgi:hypothetical protein